MRQRLSKKFRMSVINLHQYKRRRYSSQVQTHSKFFYNFVTSRSVFHVYFSTISPDNYDHADQLLIWLNVKQTLISTWTWNFEAQFRLCVARLASTGAAKYFIKSHDNAREFAEQKPRTMVSPLLTERTILLFAPVIKRFSGCFNFE